MTWCLVLHLQGHRTHLSSTHTNIRTCVAPAGDVTVAGLFEHSLSLHGQTGGKNMTTEWHTLSWHLAHCPRRQTNQGQVVIVAMGLIAWVEDNLINGVLLFVFFRDEGVVVAHSNFILLGAVSISADRNGGKDRQRPLEKEGLCVLLCACVCVCVRVRAIPPVIHKPWAVKLWALAEVTSAICHLELEKVRVLNWAHSKKKKKSPLVACEQWNRFSF